MAHPQERIASEESKRPSTPSLKRTYIYWDSEFTRVSSPLLRTVSAAFIYEGQSHVFWADDGAQPLIDFLSSIPRDVIHVAFSVESEARFMISLGLEPREWRWQCLFLEYQMMNNHNHEISYGRHLVDGKVKRLRPFVDEKGKTSLAAALWKMCEIEVDTIRKTLMRDLIISDPIYFTNSEIKEICEYNISDTAHLPTLQRAIADYMMKKLPKDQVSLWFEESLRRGDYAVESAWMVTHGYPINVEWARNLTMNVEPLLDACIRDINSQFPGEYQPFRFNKATFRWVKNESNWRKWIKDNGHEKDWPLTEGGKTGNRQLSLAIDAWTDRFNFTHTYPRNNFGAQIVRYLKLGQSLNGFRQKAGKDKKTFWDYVGDDGRVRPYFGIFVAQSARSQPAATGYIPLKPAWQRTLIHPPKGKMIVGIDYSSQEFLLAALFSNDRKMIAAYKSGDVYLAFGKLIGLIPPDGTKQSHKFERDACKATVLGLSYLMTKYGLARKLTVDTGRVWTEDEAQEQVEAFEEAFDIFYEFRQDVIERYKDLGYIKLKDGYYMFGSNSNDRSVGNVGIQGAGSDIMRRSVMNCTRKNNLKVILTLHDALYVEVDTGDWAAVDRFINSMKDGFTSYFQDTEQYEDSKMIRLDTYAWGDDLEETTITTPEGHKVDTMPIFIDERAVEEYEHFKKFFMETSGVDAL